MNNPINITAITNGFLISWTDTEDSAFEYKQFYCEDMEEVLDFLRDIDEA